ncbi:MAG TPA: glycoside hydrolase family 3 N-terminal domain-containing protein [Microbacterium sp.]|nr:glycoside hydrolase family 3 N-terminal domain-containing protein [Microbacterium sp.]
MTQVQYLDSSLPIADRVDDLLRRMSIEEKTGQLTQYFYLPGDGHAGPEQTTMVRAAVSQGAAGSVLFAKDVEVTNMLQRIAVAETRLGIPLLFGFDVVHGLRTIFPAPIALAASWSPALIESVQAVAAREARAVGIHWTFAPMVDIARDPRWGRIFEGAGEDPVLAAAVAAAQVRGFQGDLGPASVISGPKHFVGYGAGRGGRDYDDVEMSDSELWNVCIPPFRSAIDAGARTVMSAYMDFNGVPAAASRRLISDTLREELAFDGLVFSDANAVRSLETQHFARDQKDAAVRALRAGLDMEMCSVDPAFAHLASALADGAITEQEIDDAVRRVLALKFELGLFERPFADEDAAIATLDAAPHRELAADAAAQSMVLLRNERRTLPLDAAVGARIAVIGQLADSPRDTLGPWCFDHDTAETVSILDGIRRRATSAEVRFVAGAGIAERVHPSGLDGMDVTIPATAPDHDDDDEIARAVELAEASDVAIVVVGQRQNQIGEQASVASLDLPGRQQEQLERIVGTGTPVVVVVMAGRPLDLRWAAENVASILHAWYPGTRGGDAVASVLFGDVSPAGRLPFTWPRHVGQVPMIYAHNRTFAPHSQQERYVDEEITGPLFPFGFGLSYAEFAYRDLRLDAERISLGGSVRVSVEVENTSDRDGDEVVQLYIHQRHGTSTRPVRELKAFSRVSIAAGRSTTVEFEVGPQQLRYWSSVTGGYVQDATTIDIWVGPDSTAALGTVLEVAG